MIVPNKFEYKFHDTHDFFKYNRPELLVTRRIEKNLNVDQLIIIYKKKRLTKVVTLSLLTCYIIILVY